MSETLEVVLELELQIEFRCVRYREAHPYGSTTAVETIYDLEPTAYRLAGQEVTRAQLASLLGEAALRSIEEQAEKNAE